LSKLSEIVPSWSCLKKLTFIIHTLVSIIGSGSLWKILTDILFPIELLRAIAKQEKLLPALIKIDQNFKPEQIDSIHVLLGKLNELGSIFLSLNTMKQ